MKTEARVCTWESICGRIMVPIRLKRPTSQEDIQHMLECDRYFTGRKIRVVLELDPNEHEKEVEGQEKFKDFGAFVVDGEGLCRSYITELKYREARIMFDKLDGIALLNQMVNRSVVLTVFRIDLMNQGANANG